jgi:hypothetical protein
MKKTITFLAIFWVAIAYSQVGIGTINPNSSSILDLTATNKAFLLPKVANTAAIASPVNGMMIYDMSSNCVKSYEIGAWSNCLSLGANVQSVLFNATGTTEGFQGFFCEGTAISGQTFKVKVTNNSFSSSTIAFSAADLSIPGLTVTAASPTSLSLIAGQVATVTYSLSGTIPANGVTMTGTFTKLTETTRDTKTITAGTITALTCASSVQTVPTSNTAYNYMTNISIPYAGGDGCTIPATTFNSMGVTGLTASLATTTLTLGSGNVSLIISGTPSASGTAQFTVIIGGQTCTINVCAVNYATQNGSTSALASSSCKKIKDNFPSSTNGVYWIDPDGCATAFSPLQAQCDMTTDSGGWTLVSNFNHLQGTSPTPSVISKYPLISSTSLGINESSNTTAWGTTNSSILSNMSFSEVRYYAIESSHNRVVHLKSNTPALITALKTSNTTMASANFTTLSGNSCSGNNCAGTKNATINRIVASIASTNCGGVGAVSYNVIISNGNMFCFTGSGVNVWMSDRFSVSDWCGSGCNNDNQSTYSQTWIK